MSPLRKHRLRPWVQFLPMQQNCVLPLLGRSRSRCSYHLGLAPNLATRWHLERQETKDNFLLEVIILRCLWCIEESFFVKADDQSQGHLRNKTIANWIGQPSSITIAISESSAKALCKNVAFIPLKSQSIIFIQKVWRGLVEPKNGCFALLFVLRGQDGPGV